MESKSQARDYRKCAGIVWNGSAAGVLEGRGIVVSICLRSALGPSSADPLTARESHRVRSTQFLAKILFRERDFVHNYTAFLQRTPRYVTVPRGRITVALMRS
jgi:hypothetical protein